MLGTFVVVLALIGKPAVSTVANPVRGRVVSMGSVIPGVTITVTAADGKPRYAITNADGEFAFDVPLATNCVRAELAGFETVEASISNISTPMEIELGPPLNGAITVSCVLPNFISCHVASSVDDSPIKGVELSLTIGDDADSGSGFTGAHGEAFAVVGGDDVRPYRLLVRKRGYLPAEIRGVLPGTGFTIRVALEPQ